MKILVVSQYYYPEQFRINDICEQLVTDGHSVTVLTGLPNYPDGIIHIDYKWGKRREIVNGVKIIRSFELARGKGAIRLGINYLSYMVSASIKILFMKKNFDLIFVYQLSPVTMAFPAIIAKKITKLPLYLYCCDIWPESMKNIIPNESNLIYKLVKKFSTYLYSRCDGIGITSKPFFKYFNEEHSIPIEKINYIPQHAEETYLRISEPQNNGIVDFMFMGNIGIAQDIDCIIDAVQRLKGNLKFKVHFVGDGSYLDRCKLFVENTELSNYIVFHGRHPVDKMYEFYCLADACLLTLKNDNLIGLTVPSKLQGYMAAGRPVFGAIDGAAQEIINESHCGKCVNAGDSEALASVMKEFIEKPEKYKNCGKNGREYFKENFTKDIFIKKLTYQFESLLEVN